ncbi:MAG: hypothetical protein ABS948_04065 [Solibacillus sp.]
MDVGKLSSAASVAQYEKSSTLKTATEEQAPVESSAVQPQDKVEISKEALAAASGNAQETTKEEPKSSVLKMSDEERAALVSRLKEQVEQDRAKFFDFVRNTLAGQNKALAEADDVWQFIASGKYEVDADTKAKAQEAISEEGYYGVKQTSERLYDFALAMLGGDPEKMKMMESAFEEGFKEATKSWGKELPEISKQTYDAVKEKFAAFYKEETGVK